MAAFYQPIKSKALKLKYTLSNNLKANEFTDSLNRKQTVDLLIFHESFDFISFPIFLPCNKKLQEHWVIKLNIQTIK